MIDVLVRQKNRLHIRKLEVQRVESLIDSLHRHPHIHQHMRMVRADVAAVPAGTTGDTRKSHKMLLAFPLLSLRIRAWWARPTQRTVQNPVKCPWPL